MQTRHRIAPLVALLWVTLGAAACAPNNARELRELKPTTVGFVGAVHRPDPDSAFGGLASVTGRFQFDRITSDSAKDDDDYRETEIRSAWGLGGFYHRYPMADSAFFFGGALSYGKASFEFQERTNAYTATNKQTTKVAFDTSDVLLGVPLGWNWIWPGGFTLMLDLGPRIRLSHSRSFSDDGKDGNVDVDRRDDYVDDLEGRGVSFGGGLLIGYSF